LLRDRSLENRSLPLDHIVFPNFCRVANIGKIEKLITVPESWGHLLYANTLFD